MKLNFKELFRLEKTSKSPSPTFSLAVPSLPVDHVTKYHIYMSFECPQRRWLNYFPVKHAPMPHNSSSEEIFPNIQPKLPLVQLEPAFSCLITCCLGEETKCPWVCQWRWGLEASAMTCSVPKPLASLFPSKPGSCQGQLPEHWLIPEQDLTVS